jgi:hypothetical protein
LSLNKNVVEIEENGLPAQYDNNLGSSETTRVTSYTEDNDQFGYWLAGLIDGDGSLLVSKENLPSIEITLHEEDVKTLYKIKYILGFGSVSKRSKVKAFRGPSARIGARARPEGPLDFIIKKV